MNIVHKKNKRTKEINLQNVGCHSTDHNNSRRQKGTQTQKQRNICASWMFETQHEHACDYV